MGELFCGDVNLKLPCIAPLGKGGLRGVWIREVNRKRSRIQESGVQVKTIKSKS
jgi:hypothetical protein